MAEGVARAARPIYAGTGDLSMESVLADADGCFCYSMDQSYQERAHAYLVHRARGREAGDTAVQCVVRDLAERAYRAGLADGGAGRDAGDLVRAAFGELADLASAMGEVRRALGVA